MVKKNKTFSRLFQNKQFLIILSIVLSLILWFFVALSLSPDYTYTIYNVPVNVNLGNSSLQLFNEFEPTIDITVTGKRYVVSQLKASDFIVSVPLSKVTAPGEYRLEVTPSYSGIVNQSDFMITNYNEKSLIFNFDYFESKTFIIEPDISALVFAEDHTADLPNIINKEITIEGAKTEVDKIKKVSAAVKKESNEKISKTVTYPADIVLYDESDEVYTPKSITLSTQTVDVTIPVVYSEDIPLTVSFLNQPEYFANSPLKYEVTPKTALVTGNNELLSTLTDISVGEIDFAKLDLSKDTFSFDFNLPKGITSIEGLEKVEVKLDLSGYKKETVDITNFKIINQPANSDITPLTTTLKNVTIIMPKNLEIPSAKNLYAEIDIENKSYNAGKYNLSVTIHSNTINNMWAVGSYKVSIQVK